VLRSGETLFEYERKIQPRPKLGRWTSALDELLASNAAKPAREQLTLIRIFEELRGRGYKGGYDAVRRYARRWSKAHGQSTAIAYVPLSFAPGEAYQFDWSHEIVVLNGATITVKVAHARLRHSRMPFVRAYPREPQEMVFGQHPDPAWTTVPLPSRHGALCLRRSRQTFLANTSGARCNRGAGRL
jgi:transposase